MSDRVPLTVWAIDANGNRVSDPMEVDGLVITTRDLITDEPSGTIAMETDGTAVIVRGDSFVDDDDTWQEGQYCRRRAR